MKTCGRCRQLLDFEFFHRRGTVSYQSICKSCRASDDKKRYEEDPVVHSLIRKRRKKALQTWMQELKDRPCTDCGNSYHFSAMQWDHIGNDKLLNISDMINLGLSKKRILAEIAKCELVCANCHAIRTFNRRLIA